MIKIIPYFDNEPNELWQEATKKRNKTKNNPNGLSKIELALIERSKHAFDNSVYGHKAVKDKLEEIFNHKCAFCETHDKRAKRDIEHFRPKSIYYWLSYEWTNFLLSCQACNREYKKVSFPIENETNRLNLNVNFDKQDWHIEKLTHENTLLLHPVLDDPKEHLSFLQDGEISALTKKGEVSIKGYGLNADDLIKARKEIVYDFRKDVWKEYKHTIPNTERITIVITEVIAELVERIENKEKEYIGFATTILENFEAFIIDNQDLGIDMPDKDIMRQVARSILQ